MSDLFNLPHLDEDGYFDGFTACQNDKDGQPLLPPDVVNTKAPADDPKTADAYYKWDAEGKKWLAEKKPTTAAECVALGPVDHYKQTDRMNALRALYQKLVEADNTKFQIVRGDNLEWKVEAIPKKTVEEVRTEKTSELDAAFNSWYTDGATMKSSLGFEADSDSRAMQDVNGLVTAAEAQATFDTDGTLVFMDANNQGHAVTLDQLKVLQLEIINSGNLAYQQKWKIRDAIAKAKTKEELEAITIKFTPADFTASA